MRRLAWLFFLAALGLPGQDDPAEFNVNARYRVSSVDIVPAKRYRFSASLAGELKRLVGENFNQETVDRLARRIRNELQVRTVHQRVTKGADPETVKVVFEIERWKNELELSVPKFVYHSKEGWTGAVEANLTVGATRLKVGLVSDGDELVERYAGVRAGVERLSVFTDRVRLGFEFESYHQQWSPSTLAALEDGSGIYRTRQNFEPSITIQLLRQFSLSAGASMERFQSQFPAARTEAANAAVLTLRFQERWERADTRQGLDAGYSLRAATRQLDSDYVYTRHRWNATYSCTFNRQRVVADFTAGAIRGGAPLFERFVAGNSLYLRGWNRADIAPLGADRLVHGTLEYQYRALRLFYDTGSIWNRGANARIRNSLGIGLNLDNCWPAAKDRPYRKGFTVAVAFPVKEGRAEPVVLVGMNF